MESPRRSGFAFALPAIEEAAMTNAQETFRYRGVDVNLQVERSRAHVFGHADLFADGAFMGRVSLGSASSPDTVRDRLRCLAKAKVDVGDLVRNAEAECARYGPEAPPANRASKRRRQAS